LQGVLRTPATLIPNRTQSKTTVLHKRNICPGASPTIRQLCFQSNPLPFQISYHATWCNRSRLPTAHNKSLETIAAFDFNRSPMACQVWQTDYSTFLNCIEAIKLPDSDIYKTCDYLTEHYPGVLWVVTGDATGRASSALVKDNLNYYKVIKAKLNLGDRQIKVPTINPNIQENKVLCNAVLQRVNVAIDPVNCKALIFDLTNVRVNADGTLEKKNRKDPTQQADHADIFRYVCNQFFKHILKMS